MVRLGKELELRPYPLTAVEGEPIAKWAVTHRIGSGEVVQGVWECTEGSFSLEFTWEELAFILEGEVSISYMGSDGTVISSHSLRAGDSVHFPRGSKTVWRIAQFVRKTFVAFG